jgi:4-amino-4-deoxy-L-arabinose transferase-like glycosyltransferase
MSWLESRRKILFLIALAVVLVRLQTLWIETYSPDESNYAGGALVMLDGGVPYVDFVEKKPPLTYYFVYASFALFGPRMGAVHALTIVWVFLTALVLYRVVRFGFPRKHAALAAIGYGLFSTCFQECDSLATNCEILMNLPAALSSLALFHALALEKPARRCGWGLLSGVMLGLAFLFKHQAGIGLPVVGAWLLFSRGRSVLHRLGECVALGVGFLLPCLAVVAIYLRLGFFAELYEWNITTNLSYIATPPRLSEIVPTGVINTVAFVGANLWCFAMGAWLLRSRARTVDGGWLPVHRSLVLFHAIWLLATMLPVATGWRFYGHYYIQMYPPLCILAGIGAGQLLEGWPRLSRGIKAVFITALILPSLAFQVAALWRYRDQEFEGALRLHKKLAEATRALSSDRDPIFVWGESSFPYYYASRRPATRYILCEYVLPFWETYFDGGAFDPANTKPHHKYNYSLMLKDLAQRPPKVILDTSRSPWCRKWAPFTPDHFPELQAVLDTDYALAREIDGVRIFVRKPTQ